jgi:hypothetical protein
LSAATSAAAAAPVAADEDYLEDAAIPDEFEYESDEEE